MRHLTGHDLIITMRQKYVTNPDLNTGWKKDLDFSAVTGKAWSETGKSCWQANNLGLLGLAYLSSESALPYLTEVYAFLAI